MDTSNLYIVIPAKDEAPRIGQVLDHIRELGYGNVVVVDDGSRDETGDIAARYGVTVLRHRLNLGAGAATQTGIEYALRQGAETIVTLDGDHQHLPSDIEHLVSALAENKADIVLGSRFFGNNTDIPAHRVIYNKIGNWITYIFTGMWVSDSQSGMKAIHASFAGKAAIQRNGFEFCIEIIKNIKLHKAKWCEVPISVVYTKETLAKGQGFFSGLKMVVRMVKSVL